MKKALLSAILFFICTLVPVAILPNQALMAGTQTMKPGTATVQLPLPDLIVERLWLDSQCKINFKLKNRGSAKIPDNQYGRALVKLFIGSTEVIYSLSQPMDGNPAVDPSGLLKPAGGAVSFNTGKILQEKRLVRVLVNHTDQIRESNTHNNTARESLDPKCPSAPGTAAATTLPRPAASSPGTVPAGPTQVSLPKPSIEITTFHYSRVGTSTMVTTTTGASGGDSLPDDMAYITAGKEFAMRWRIEGCHAAQVKSELTVENPEGTAFSNRSSRITETRTNKVGDCFFINGSAKLTEYEDWDYTLTVTASTPGRGIAKAERRFHIRINKEPNLIVEKPEFNEADMTVRFFIKNQGEADYPAPGADLRGSFRIGNWDGSRTLKSGTIYKEDLALPKGAKVEIANMTLDRAALGDYTKILCEAVLDDEYNDNYDYLRARNRSGSKLFELSTRTATLDASILLAFFDSITGEIRLNNYRPTEADPTGVWPGRSRDSYIQIMGEENRVVFTPPFERLQLKSTVTGNIIFDYRAFFNNVNATIGGPGTTSISDRNTVKMHIAVDTSGSAELKGWKHVLREHLFYDSEAPDINVTKLELDVYFHINLRDGKLVIDGVWVKPTVNLVATDDFAWLINMMTPRIERMAKNEIAGYISSVANKGDVKGKMNAKIAEALDLLNIERILRFELNSTGLSLTYIPGH